MSSEPAFFDCESGIQSRAAFHEDMRRIAGGLRAACLSEGDAIALLMGDDGPLAQTMDAVLDWLAFFLRSPTPAFLAGLPQPGAVRTTLVRGTAQKGRVNDGLRTTPFRGKVKQA